MKLYSFLEGDFYPQVQEIMHVELYWKIEPCQEEIASIFQISNVFRNLCEILYAKFAASIIITEVDRTLV